MKKYKTKAGKEIALFICPKTNHIKVQFSSGGELPEELTGLFTSEREADKVITSYLERKANQVRE